MSKVDRNEAPEGYVARRFRGVKGYDCNDCAFNDENKSACSDDRYGCGSNKRKDGQSVIFVKKTKQGLNMPLYEETIERLTAEFEQNIAALAASKQRIRDAENVAALTGNKALVSVMFGQPRVWLIETVPGSLMTDGAQLKKPIQFVGHRPVYTNTLFDIEFEFTENE